MSLPPVEIPLGAMRFNSDSQKLEYFNGQVWMQVHTFNPDLDGGARGVIMGGATPSMVNTIQYVTIPTAGNAVDFGDRTVTGSAGQFSSNTRAVCGGRSAPSYVNTVDYVTMSSTGNALDFGDKTTQDARSNGASNQTRGFTAGGFHAPAADDHIDYCTIASTGNFVDFGNLMSNQERPSGNINSPTRVIWSGGDTDGAGNYTNNISYITIATTGNAQDFGDTTVGRTGAAGLSSSTRGLIGGGYVSPGGQNNIEYITIATTGHSTDFGDLTEAKYAMNSVTDSVRGLFAGGVNPVSDTICFVNISTQGNAVDFGNLLAAQSDGGGCSTAHGGLG